MNDNKILENLNGQWPPSVTTLGGHGLEFDQNVKTLQMSFQAIPNFCHSQDIVQGGYITGMLDAVMAYAVIGLPDVCQGVATLEIKVNFIAPGHPGEFESVGQVVHLGRSIAYLSGELRQNQKLVATATSTIKLIRGKTG